MISLCVKNSHASTYVLKGRTSLCRKLSWKLTCLLCSDCPCLGRLSVNQVFQLTVHDFEENRHNDDIWPCIWGTAYTSSKYYNHTLRSITPPAPSIWIWKSKCIPRVKFFGWLLLSDHLNTRNILRPQAS